MESMTHQPIDAGHPGIGLKGFCSKHIEDTYIIKYLISQHPWHYMLLFMDCDYHSDWEMRKIQSLPLCNSLSGVVHRYLQNTTDISDAEKDYKNLETL